MRFSAAFILGILAFGPSFGPSFGGDTMHTQGNSVIPSTQAVILDEQPLTENEVLTTLDIVSEQTLLGPGDEKFLVREGQVRVGKPRLYFLTLPKVDGARFVALPGDKISSFYLVVFPFSLEPAPGKRRYSKMSFKVALSNPQATAFKLIPERVVSEEDVKKNYDIGFDISLSGDKSNPAVTAGVSGKATQNVEFVRLIPEITAFGSGNSLFYWQYTGHVDQSLAPGARTAAAVIQVPQGTRRLTATIAWDIELERYKFEKWFNIPTKIEQLPVEIPLL